MKHLLTIDPTRCYGLTNCRACEIIMPGLVGHCLDHGELIIEEWAMQANSARISQVLAGCVPRAIMVRPVG